MKNIYIIAILLLLIAGCKKETKNTLPATGGLYIINEGNFNFGNAEISYYDPQSKEVVNNVFSGKNGFQLGDVAQSMYIQDSTGFIVVNNSAKIEVVRLPSMQWMRTITIPGSSPRYFLPLNDSIAYVTELYAKKIWIVNYLNGSLHGSIPTTGWTEKMFKKGSFVFVQQKKNSLVPGTYSAILRINSINHSTQNINSFNGREVLDITADKSGNIWASISEDTATLIKASICQLSDVLQPVKQFSFSEYGQKAYFLHYGAANDKFWYYSNSLYQFSASDASLPASPIVSTTGKNIYSMFINQVNSDVYLSDAIDYVQPSQIYRYSSNGDFIHNFAAGVITGNFAYYEP